MSAGSGATSSDAVGDAGGQDELEMDMNVERLRLCAEQGVPVVPTEDGKGFLLGDYYLPKV